LRSRFVLAAEELATLFKPGGHQSDINDYFSGISETEPQIEKIESVIAPIANPPVGLLSTGESSRAEIKPGKKKKQVEQYQTTLF
jgi:hypothetical protein